MAAVAGGGDEMLLLRPRRRPRLRSQRLPFSDLTNLSPATSVVTRLLKPKPRTSPDSSTSSIGSSTAPRIPMPPPPPPPATLSEQTVIATGEYKEPITQKDVADYAMKMINAGGKDTNAQTYVDNLKDRYGNGISVKCLIYNATGTTLNKATYNDWHGHIYETPYPSDIQNGQWGAFLHVHPKGAAVGSAGAVVYRSKVPSSNSSCDWLFSWTVPYIGGNGVHTEIREEGHFPKHWDYIYNVKLAKSNLSSTDNGYGYASQTDIGEGTTMNARAVFQLPY